MRDEHPRLNGHPVPNGRPRPVLNGVARPVGGFTQVLPADGDDDHDGAAPLDFVAVQADDELVGALGARSAGPGRPAGGRDLPGGGDDRLVALLRAWRAEIDAEPIPELVDLDTAVAAVLAGVQEHERATRRRRSGRLRHLAPLVAAAAIIVATVSGVGLGSQDAMPGDTLWAVQKVVNPERAESVEAKVAVESHLQKVRSALAQGDTVTAAQELEAIRTQIPVVRGEEGLPLLVQEQEFLAAKLADTPPGTPADLSTPARSNPAARSTGAPAAPPPAGTLPTSASSAPASGSPSSGAPGKPDRPPAGVPADPSSAGGDPAAPAPERRPAPQTTREPEAPAPAPLPAPAPAPAPNPDPVPPPKGEGTPDGPPPPPPASGGDGPAPSGDPGTTATETATASGSAGASGAATAPDAT